MPIPSFWQGADSRDGSKGIVDGSKMRSGSIQGVSAVRYRKWDLGLNSWPYNSCIKSDGCCDIGSR